MLTDRGDYEMMPNYGTRVYDLIDERFDDATTGALVSMIEEALDLEPSLIDLESLEIARDDEGQISALINNTFEITLGA